MTKYNFSMTKKYHEAFKKAENREINKLKSRWNTLMQALVTNEHITNTVTDYYKSDQVSVKVPINLLKQEKTKIQHSNIPSYN